MARRTPELAGDPLPTRCRCLQPLGHARPPGFQRGHLPHPDRGRQRGDGARRRPQWRQGGIEEQTRKLFEVCRLRDEPIITFVNKLDREGRDPFDLLDEIQQSLALDVTPASWPLGMGRVRVDDPMKSTLLSAYSQVHTTSSRLNCEPASAQAVDRAQYCSLTVKWSI